MKTVEELFNEWDQGTPFIREQLLLAFAAGHAAALEAVAPMIRDAQREADAITAGETAWRHEGDYPRSMAMDRAARHQAQACVDAIRAGKETP